MRHDYGFCGGGLIPFCTAVRDNRAGRFARLPAGRGEKREINMKLKKISRLTVYALVLCMLLPQLEVFAAWDGFKEVSASDGVDLMDLNSAGSIIT